MDNKKIVVPEGMLDYFWLAFNPDRDGASREDALVALASALLWLSEHPIVPTDEQANDLWTQAHILSVDSPTGHAAKDLCIEWQRRMFLAPEPEVPEAIKDLLYSSDNELDIAAANTGMHASNDRVIEAYRRGKESR